MGRSEPANPMDAVATIVGVLLALAGCAVLTFASLVFSYYGICEDTCDAPARTLGGALGAGLPWALGALVLLTSSSYLFMSGRRRGTAKVLWAGLLGVLAAVLFEGGLWLVGVTFGAFTNSDSALPLVLGMGSFMAVWLPGLVVTSRRVARHR